MKFKKQAKDDDESITDVSDDYDEDDEEEDMKHSDLLYAIDKFSKTHDKPTFSTHPTQSQDESSTYQSHQGLSLNNLLDGLGNFQGIGSVKDNLSDLDKTKSATYVERTVADRIERQQTYEGAKVEVGKWHNFVVNNRFAPTLDLAVESRPKPRGKSLVQRFEPTTPFEKEINMVLINSGLTEDALAQKEVEELQSKSISLEEIKQRQADLAKVSAFMFYDQMKRHRINKIKSKAFRSIKRKLRKRLEQDSNEQLSQLDEEEAAAIQEQSALDRVKERMDLRHKNTSSWAKEALKFGHTNKSLRDAYHDSVRMGHELTKKMTENVALNGDEDNEQYEENSGPKKSISEMAADELETALAEDSKNIEAKVSGKYKKLFEMDFMKKSQEQQKERAREQAKEVLKAIQLEEEEEYQSELENGNAAHMETTEIEQKKHFNNSTEKVAAKEKIASSLKNSFEFIQNGKVSTFQAHLDTEVKAADSVNKKATESSLAPAKTTENPWLSQETAPKQRKTQQRSKDKHDADIAIEVALPIASNAAGISSKKRKLDAVSSVVKPEDAKSQSTSLKPASLIDKTAEDLLHTAFSGADYENEFLSHKQQEIDHELGLDEKRSKVLKDVKSGWGDWAGPGAMEISPKIIKKRDQMLVKIQTENETKRMERKDASLKNVMISERRIKNVSKYKVSEIPYPFKSREEYERSLQMPVGEEWNATHIVNKLTEPEVKTKSGRIIEPVKYKKGLMKA